METEANETINFTSDSRYSTGETKIILNNVQVMLLGLKSDFYKEIGDPAKKEIDILVENIEKIKQQVEP